MTEQEAGGDSQDDSAPNPGRTIEHCAPHGLYTYRISVTGASVTQLAILADPDGILKYNEYAAGRRRPWWRRTFRRNPN